MVDDALQTFVDELMAAFDAGSVEAVRKEVKLAYARFLRARVARGDDRSDARAEGMSIIKGAQQSVDAAGGAARASGC